MSRWRRSLSLRLALAFALVSLLLLGGIGLYLYRSLQQEIAWRDDQTLLGRLDRMETLLRDTPDIQQLRERPELYANMLGNTEHFLWVLNSAGEVLISINPHSLPLPSLRATAQPRFDERSGALPYRLVAQQSFIHGDSLTLVAGHLLDCTPDEIERFFIDIIGRAGSVSVEEIAWIDMACGSSQGT